MNAYPVELEPPDIAPYRAGNCGIDYVTSFDSGKAGPHLMLAALTHGNEICGAIALDWLLRQGVRPRAGRLTLAFMNVAAYARFNREDPSASRCVDEDFNRLWSAEVLDGTRDSVELRRARELRPIVGSVDAMLRFLLHFGAIESGLAREGLAPLPASQCVIEVTQAVTIANDEFRFAAPYVGMEVIARTGTVIGHDGGAPVVTPYNDCVLIMPSKRLRKGETAVRLGRIVAG